MPTYLHICNAEHCNHEWEEFYSMKDDPPTICPKCKIEGKVQRLISGGSGRGIVELTGNELKAKVKQDAAEYKNRAMKDQNLRANLVGEDSYQRNVVRNEAISKDRYRR